MSLPKLNPRLSLQVDTSVISDIAQGRDDKAQSQVRSDALRSGSDAVTLPNLFKKSSQVADRSAAMAAARARPTSGCSLDVREEYVAVQQGEEVVWEKRVIPGLWCSWIPK